MVQAIQPRFYQPPRLSNGFFVHLNACLLTRPERPWERCGATSRGADLGTGTLHALGCSRSVRYGKHMSHLQQCRASYSSTAVRARPLARRRVRRVSTWRRGARGNRHAASPRPNLTALGDPIARYSPSAASSRSATAAKPFFVRRSRWRAGFGVPYTCREWSQEEGSEEGKEPSPRGHERTGATA